VRKWPDDFIDQIICGDCFDVMKEMPDNSIDLIITDPPYGMNFQSNHRKIKYDKIKNDDTFPLWIFDEFNRITKKAIYIFCRWDNLTELPKPTSVLAWIKNNWSMGDLKHEHGRQWEAICFYPKQEHEFEKRIPDVIKAKRTGNNFHATEKPIDVMMSLIQANKGELVLDPFAGSGSTLVAAQALKRKFIGVEIDTDYCETARQRLRQQTLI
jgi:site-specific DNA-methyltransferase (adenine-specific)